MNLKNKFLNHWTTSWLISAGNHLQEVQQARKCPTLHPTSRSSLEAICLLQPPAAISRGRGGLDQTRHSSQLDQAFREVFRCILGLGDELFGSERPSTAPSETITQKAIKE
ncbi:hypothetical protein OS493_034701 [Desmophyllum pertusum]|uniref:Uncharacterized protein n=1 Tax=Desmophyllum pertusum TaxID=174260 RepID=A0A9X0CWW3_9CNID|nr:hypothetical protein OS493_034701 [Desmophyllum pertusum]